MVSLRVGLCVLSVVCAAAVAPVTAQTIDRPGSPRVTTDSTVPQRGLSMEQVRRQYGEPQRRRAAVGDPPITRWDYPDYSVFFEYQTVLHSVAHPERQAAR